MSAETVRGEATGADALLVQAGAGLSTSLRDEENDFDRITLHPRGATVTRHAAVDGAFAPRSDHEFRQGGTRRRAA